MSDLQCPATLLFARPGEVEPVVNGVSSVEGGELTDRGREQVHHLVEHVRPRRVAAVYSSPMKRAVESAELAAAQLGLLPVVVDRLGEFSLGELTQASSQRGRADQEHDAWMLENLDLSRLEAEDIDRVAKRFTEAIGDIADAHRGEAVLVFTHSGPMSLVIPRLAVNVGNELAGQRFLLNCAVAEVQIDADGWRIVSWPTLADL